MTLSQWLAAWNAADTDLMRADYLDSTVRGDQVRADATARLTRLNKTFIPHTGDDSPILPGIPVLVRFRGSLVQCNSPERLDWSEVTEWRPIL